MNRLSMHPYFYNPACGASAQDDVTSRRLCIDSDAWLGANALILPGCRYIGRGAVVAAGAVVTQDVAPYSIVAGNPARKICDRFSQHAIKAAEDSEWWLGKPSDLRNRFDMTRDWHAQTLDSANRTKQ
ncbi:MAG: hypothetical protein HRT77_06950 [Halioglobus sp.]|nr:hypothetical protein [Halioglobus sp.]